MGYSEALEANGVEVTELKHFGDYQGTWIARLADGRFVEGSYGSCSVCDSFQAEFGWNDDYLEKQKDGSYYRNNWIDPEDLLTEEQANEHNEKVREKLKTFGYSYLSGAETKEEITERFRKKTEEEYAWEDDKEIYEWLKNL